MVLGCGISVSEDIFVITDLKQCGQEGGYER